MSAPGKSRRQRVDIVDVPPVILVLLVVCDGQLCRAHGG
jgi:hypothetical protein